MDKNGELQEILRVGTLQNLASEVAGEKVREVLGDSVSGWLKWLEHKSEGVDRDKWDQKWVRFCRFAFKEPARPGGNVQNAV